MSSLRLIELHWSSHGIGYAISVENMAKFLGSERVLPPRTELAEELRRLARLLEAGHSPFSNYTAPNLHESRGSAEAEMDRLGLHITRLQERGA